MIISLDSESTGLDWAHGAMPFLVTWCEVGQEPYFWEWPVDPVTRRPDVPAEDIAEIAALLDEAELIYLQNAKYDCHMLDALGLSLPWEKVRDTLVMGHLLATNHGHSLDEMCVEYLGVDILKYETEVKRVVKECRSLARRYHPQWRIADGRQTDMPSVSGSGKSAEERPWKNDMWLPRALWRDIDEHRARVPRQPEWETVCSQYACADSAHTLPLGLEMERRIRQRGLWAIYEHRMQLPRAYYDMECRGLTAIGDHTERTITQYEQYIAEVGDALGDIASEYGHDLELAAGAALNDNMRDFFYGAVTQVCPRCDHRRRVKHWNGERVQPNMVCEKCAGPLQARLRNRRSSVRVPVVTDRRENLALEPIYNDKTGNATLDKNAMTEYLITCDGNARDFIRLLLGRRKHSTDLSYMESYRRYWVPCQGAPGYFRIHPSLNPCGTDHLRASSSDPNCQNVGVQEDRCEECEGRGGRCHVCHGSGKSRISVRQCFGPLPGREWWDFDFQNLEKRVPVYECGEEALIEVFEKPNDPPYWGSDHNVLASLLFPEEYWPIAQVEGEFKRLHLGKYKRVKNTNFAKQYGAGRTKVDATAGVRGAFDLIERGLPEIARLQAKYLALAERVGYVETLPDRTVDSTRGYPILASRMEDGRVLSTTPFNYHVSATACWVKNTGLLRCAAQCAAWRAEGFDAHIALEVHDSILFDFPRGADMQENLPRALVLRGLMEQGGRDLVPSIPTPVSMEYHVDTWAHGVSYKEVR